MSTSSHDTQLSESNTASSSSSPEPVQQFHTNIRTILSSRVTKRGHSSAALLPRSPTSSSPLSSEHQPHRTKRAKRTRPLPSPTSISPSSSSSSFPSSSDSEDHARSRQRPRPPHKRSKRSKRPARLGKVVRLYDGVVIDPISGVYRNRLMMDDFWDSWGEEKRAQVKREGSR